MENKWKPCPFCGNNKIKVFESDEKYVYCNYCEVLLHKDDWNIRYFDNEVLKRFCNYLDNNDCFDWHGDVKGFIEEFMKYNG